MTLKQRVANVKHYGRHKVASRVENAASEVQPSTVKERAARRKKNLAAKKARRKNR